MKIKAVVRVVTSRADMYGNRYSYADVTNTRNGKSVRALTHSESNARAEVRETLGLDFGEFTTNEIEIPIREWNRLAKDLPHDLSKELPKAFDRFKVAK